MALGTRYIATADAKGEVTRGVRTMGSTEEPDKVDVFRDANHVLSIVAQSSTSQEKADELATQRYAEVTAHER